MTGSIDQGLAFALTMLFAACALFVLSMMMMTRARSHFDRRSADIRHRSKELEQACADLTGRLQEREKELRQKEAEIQALGTEITQIRKMCVAAEADSFQILHEVGLPEHGTARFDIEVVLSTVAMNEGGLRVDPRVWSIRNVAQVWAPDSREAIRAAGRAFPDRYGFVLTRVLSDGSLRAADGVVGGTGAP